MGMKKLKIGIIGCGGIAKQKHLPALKENADLNEMIAFCDIVEERALEAAKKFGGEDAKVYTDYRELLANPDIDVVHVCTPNVSHSEITVAAFEAGKHVYCEKPMSHSGEEAERWWKHGKSPEKNLRLDIRIVSARKCRISIKPVKKGNWERFIMGRRMRSEDGAYRPGAFFLTNHSREADL